MSDLFLGQDLSATTQAPIPTITIYNDKTIWPVTFFGGPLAAGYVIAANFEAFDEPGYVAKTWIITIISTVIIFGISFLASPAVQKALFGIYSAVAYMLIRYHQGEKIDAHISAGGATHSSQNIVGVCVFGLVISSIPTLLMMGGAADTPAPRGIGGPVVSLGDEMPPPPIEPVQSKEYGALRHIIAFHRSNISEEEVDKFAAGMTKTDFLKGKPQKLLYIKKQGESYEIYIACNSTVETNPNAYKVFVPLRNRVQKLFPDRKIVFHLFIDNIGNVAKRIE
jgi:hypothetical protein